ncbi:hypothetical protein QUT48_23085, partial [Xanthomonas citri pv. citri]
EGRESVAARLSRYHGDRPASSGFWDLQVSDPGPARMFSSVIYVRGAMTLAALRNRVGAVNFDTIARTWVERNAGAHGTDAEFRALAEEISGQDLDGFFAHWLDDTERPARTEENGLA